MGQPSVGIIIAWRYYTLPHDRLGVRSDSVSNLKACYRQHATRALATSSPVFPSLQNRRRDSIPIAPLRHAPAGSVQHVFRPPARISRLPLTHRSWPRRRAKNALCYLPSRTMSRSVTELCDYSRKLQVARARGRPSTRHSFPGNHSCKPAGATCNRSPWRNF